MNDHPLHCRECDKRVLHRWGVGGCKCLECNTLFDPHRRKRLKTPEPQQAIKSYDGGMVPGNWRDIVGVHDERIEQEIDRVLVAMTSCTCDKPGEMECQSCETLYTSLEEIAVNSMFIARRQSYRLEWECQRDGMVRLMERMMEARGA